MNCHYINSLKYPQLFLTFTYKNPKSGWALPPTLVLYWSKSCYGAEIVCSLWPQTLGGLSTVPSRILSFLGFHSPDSPCLLSSHLSTSFLLSWLSHTKVSWESKSSDYGVKSSLSLLCFMWVFVVVVIDFLPRNCILIQGHEDLLVCFILVIV